MISALAKRRLTKLIEFMEKLPRSANKHFDMKYVLGHEGENGPGHHSVVPSKLSTKDLHACGTTACALGWACTMPYFRKAGLNLVIARHTLDGTRTAVDGGEAFDLGSVTNVDAWAELFSGSNYDKTPKQWAKRARRLLKQWAQTP